MIKVTIQIDFYHLIKINVEIPLDHKIYNMKIIFLLILLSLLIAVGFLAAFLWAVNSGQYEDDYTPSIRMLFDEETNEKNEIK